MKADYLSINKEFNEVNWPDAVLCDESIDTNWESLKIYCSLFRTSLLLKLLKSLTLINHHGGQLK